MYASTGNSMKLCFCLLFLTFGTVVAHGTTTSITVGSGALNYTVTTTSGSCFDGTQTTYTEVMYTNFSFVANGTTYSGSSQGGVYFFSPGGSCPAPGPRPTSGGTPVVTGSGFTVTFFPCGGTNCEATITGDMYPKYQVQSIIYAAPGNMSSNGFTTTTTDGTYTSIGNTFTTSTTASFSASGGFLGAGSTLGWSVGEAATTGSSTAVATTISQATGVADVSNSSNPNTINHNQDVFIIWLNPAVRITQSGASAATYALGTQPQKAGDPNPGQPEIQDQVEVLAKVMMPSASNGNLTTIPVSILVPQIVDGQTLPGLGNICANPKFYPSSCTFTNQCGCAPSDFTAILSLDPLLNFASTESPLNADTSGTTACTNPSKTAKCRYVPVMVQNGSSVQVTELLSGPECSGCNTTPNTFTQTDSTATTQTYSESISETLGFTWSSGFNILGTGFTFAKTNQLTWTQSESTGETNGYAHSASVTLNSNTVGCNQQIPIFEDTVFHTFVFQQPAGNNSCP